MWSRYNKLHAALAGDDLDSAKVASGELRTAAAALEEAELVEAGREPWAKLAATVSDATAAIAQAPEIDGARAEFEKISIASEAALRVLGSTTPMHVMHCPMAFDGRGARWLQSSKVYSTPTSATPCCAVGRLSKC